MPFFGCELGLVYFCHVPKSAGTTIERALLDNGFELSFIDNDFWTDFDKVWYKTSPQHITANDFNKLFKSDIFTYKFAIVRNPISRFISAFNHQRSRIGIFCSLETFLDRLEKNIATKDNYFGASYDNHFVPANRFILEGSQVFHLECGLTRIEDKLSELTKKEIKLGHINAGSYKTDNTPGFRGMIKKVIMPPSPKMEDLSNDVLERIKLLYKEDYDRFDFD